MSLCFKRRRSAPSVVRHLEAEPPRPDRLRQLRPPPQTNPITRAWTRAAGLRYFRADVRPFQRRCRLADHRVGLDLTRHLRTIFAVASALARGADGDPIKTTTSPGRHECTDVVDIATLCNLLLKRASPTHSGIPRIGSTAGLLSNLA
jgi:hypothetical protein